MDKLSEKDKAILERINSLQSQLNSELTKMSPVQARTAQRLLYNDLIQ